MGFNVPNIFTDVGNPPILSAQINANYASISSVLNQVFNVTYYGAKGDGVTDDSAAFADAIAAAAPVKGTVFVPSGAYVASFAPTSFVTIQGESSLTASIIPKASSGGAIYQSTGTASNIQQFRVQGIAFNCNSAADPAVYMYAESYQDISFTDCIFENMVSTGQACVDIGRGTLPTLPLTRNSTTSLRIVFERCLFQNNNCSTREALLATGWGDSVVRNCIFLDNTVVGAGVLDIYAYGDNVQVQNNIFSGNNGTSSGNCVDVVFTNGTNLSAIGNKHVGGGEYWTGYSVQNCQNVKIEAQAYNTLNGSAVWSNAVGVWMYDNSPTFDGNTVLYQNTDNVEIAGTFGNCSIGVQAPYTASTNTAMSNVRVKAMFPGLGAIAVWCGGVATAALLQGWVLDGCVVPAGSWTGPAFEFGTGAQCEMTNCFVGQSASAAYCVYIAGNGTNPIKITAYNNDFSRWTGSSGKPPIFVTTAGTLIKAANNQGYNPVGAMTAPTVGASPWTYTNTTGVDQTLNVSGGTVSAISANGVVTGLTSGSFFVPAGKTLVVTYTAAPTVTASGN